MICTQNHVMMKLVSFQVCWQAGWGALKFSRAPCSMGWSWGLNQPTQEEGGGGKGVEVKERQKK